MILCCGEALIDMIPAKTEDAGTGFVPHSGGSVFNTAIALGRLGTRAGMLTGLSRDLFGRQLDDALKASHVDTRTVVYSDRPATLAFVQLEAGHATYTFYDENSANRMLAPEDVGALPEDVLALYFGGISLCNPPAADTYLELAERHAGRCAIMLDPNIRPSFISDIPAYRARIARMLAVADIVKVSDEDLGWLYPGPEALMEKLAALLKAGPSVAIMTRGGSGATAYLRDGREISVAAEPAQVVDTVGAGDTFNAGVLAKASELGLLTPGGLAEAGEAEISDVLAFGAKVAAVTVSRAGANPPWREELAQERPPA
ncbi:carbohydrate kinase [Pseudooceanicola lipolyticus]|uniref:Carbohydrate kinase n=1 Tax=Pseudooceanicola lipolyticus TaxID=2029104 RepID=A0A2M8J2E1_9RHOB|nr:carbohydrate kinase [Pseudooceanicola lipolyticus]PJE36950.1 carbohydrate kinase [Pseudooceanicola lipolyticus]